MSTKMADDSGQAYDVLSDAEAVAAAEAERVGMPRDTFYGFETLYTVRRALLLSAIFPKATTPVDGWIARVYGPGRGAYRLDRTFLPKTRRVLQSDAPAARDCTEVRAGDVLECHRDQGLSRYGQRFTKKFLRVTSVTDAGLSALTMSEAEVAAIYHGETPR